MTKHDEEWQLNEWKKMAAQLAKILGCIPVAEEIVYQVRKLKAKEHK